MPVDIHIIIIGIDGTHQFGIIVHLHAPTLIYRALLILHNPFVDGSVVDGVDIRRLTRLRIDHRPDRASIAEHLSILPHHTEVTTGEIAHRTLHPRLHLKLRVHLRHLLHLDSESREHPRAVDGQQIPHAEAAIRRVEIRRIQHVVPQMSHHEPLREIAMKRLRHKIIYTYFIHVMYAIILCKSAKIG